MRGRKEGGDASLPSPSASLYPLPRRSRSVLARHAPSPHSSGRPLAARCSARAAHNLRRPRPVSSACALPSDASPIPTPARP
jgi:hypothetical protein